MTSVTQEEENYARMGLLLTGISLRAARVLFDKEFHPFSLKAALKEEYNKLQELKKKHVINENHWNLLFPKSSSKYQYYFLCFHVPIIMLCRGSRFTCLNPFVHDRANG